MAIILSNSYLLSLGTSDVPAWHSRLLWHSIARTGTVSASSTDTSEAMANAPVTDQTFEWWKPSSMPAWWKVDAGSATSINAVGIAVHNLSTQNCTIKVQYSTDNSTWNDISGAESTPGNNSPIMFIFDSVSARYWRIYITSLDSPQSAPRIAVCYIGQVLEMQKPIKWIGHTPGTLAGQTIKRPNMSERGQRLGTKLIRLGFAADFEVNNLDEDWIRNTFHAFIRAAREYGYFVAWRPTQFSDEVLFGWTDEDIIPENSQGGDTRLMSVSWGMKAHGTYDADIYPWDNN